MPLPFKTLRPPSHLKVLLERSLVELDEPLVLRRLVRSVSVEELAAHPFQGGLECDRDHIVHRQRDELPEMNTRTSGDTSAYSIHVHKRDG